MTIKTATLRMPQRRSYVRNTGYRRPARTSSKASASKSRAKEVVATVFAVIFLLVGVWASLEVHSVANEVARLKETHARLVAENVSLTSKLHSATDKKALEKMGRRIGLHPPKENQIIYLR